MPFKSLLRSLQEPDDTACTLANIRMNQNDVLHTGTPLNPQLPRHTNTQRILGEDFGGRTIGAVR
jgi:hypothetical protein